MSELTEPETAIIYTDDSDIKGQIRAAMYIPITQKATHQHLGKDTQYNLYLSEIAPLRLAAK